MRWFGFKAKARHPELTGRVIDMTRTTWGHNISTIKNHGDGRLRFAIWVTPKPKIGDQVKYEVALGTNIARIDKSEWTFNVDDMYFIDVTILERIPKDVQ